jgi:methyl-accepting chemotaxis protein
MISSNMKIGTRLGLAFSFVLLLMTLIGAYAVVTLGELDDEIGSMANDKYPKTVMLDDIKNHLNVAARAVRNLIILDDPKELAKETKRITEAREATAKILDKLQTVVKSEEGKARLKAVLAARPAYDKEYSAVVALIEAKEKDKGREQMLTTLRSAQQNYFNALDKMIEHQGNEVVKAGQRADHTVETGRYLIIGLLLAAILLAAAISFYIVRSITKPAAELVSVNNRLAAGDLTVEVLVTGRDEMGQLADSARSVIAGMRDILERVASTSSQVASASSQLQATAQQIATGAEEVAAQTGTVATASEEMAATSTDIARNCSMAAESSQQTSELANRGSAVVQETIAGMVRIAERVKQSARTVESLGARSEQIGAIVGTIEDIADQTNLLALNAAIEAARAGEQGRGFAVVADEVRALAERTTRATKEISAMILAIQKETKEAVQSMSDGVVEVEKGAESSEKSGQALEAILVQINEVTMQIGQIATAAEEQSATSREISNNVHQITGIMQGTARANRESMSAVDQLNRLSESLKQQISKFSF